MSEIIRIDVAKVAEEMAELTCTAGTSCFSGHAGYALHGYDGGTCE